MKPCTPETSSAVLYLLWCTGFESTMHERKHVTSGVTATSPVCVKLDHVAQIFLLNDFICEGRGGILFRLVLLLLILVKHFEFTLLYKKCYINKI